jgi:glutamate N-acetyltransferase/amino-acid N-acetyltransferase
MLVYLCTDVLCPDAATDSLLLQRLLTEAAESSFNRISIDGDTSTNDTVLLLASGASGAILSDGNAAPFAAALSEVCTSLAKQIVADAEGATHLVELNIRGAASDADALRVARAIAHSPLVKTAWAGSDPNWGRLIAATGYSGAEVDPTRITIRLGDLLICERGGRAAAFDEAAAHHYLSQPEFTVHIDLGIGSGACRFWTCDLTREYVSINADYST